MRRCTQLLVAQWRNGEFYESAHCWGFTLQRNHSIIHTGSHIGMWDFVSAMPQFLYISREEVYSNRIQQSLDRNPGAVVKSEAPACQDSSQRRPSDRSRRLSLILSRGFRLKPTERGTQQALLLSCASQQPLWPLAQLLSSRVFPAYRSPSAFPISEPGVQVFVS